MLVVVVHSILFFILLLFFICCCSSFILFFIFVVVLHSLLFNVIPHPSVDYCRVFTPILYFQPSPSQSYSRHFHFNISEIFFHSFTASATVLSGHFLHTGIFYVTLLHRHFPAFIKTSLGAGSSSLNFAVFHTDPRNTDPVHLFV